MALVAWRFFRDFTRVNDCIKLNACSHARASQLLANHSLHSVCALRAWALCSAGLGASLAASKSISYYHMGQYITVVSLKRAVRYARVMVGIPGALHYLLSEATYVMALQLLQLLWLFFCGYHSY